MRHIESLLYASSAHLLSKVLFSSCPAEQVVDMAARERRPQSPVALAASVAVAVFLVGIGTVGWRWYSYVTAGATPYDELGIEVNSRLPEPLRAWGCARIMERFPRAVPPYGCPKPKQ